MFFSPQPIIKLSQPGGIKEIKRNILIYGEIIINAMQTEFVHKNEVTIFYLKFNIGNTMVETFTFNIM